MTHTFYLLDIIVWWLHGMLQRILFEIPLISPMQEPVDPPELWLYFDDANTWLWVLDPDRRPTEGWLYSWNSYVGRAAALWVEETAEWFADAAQNAIEEILGWLPSGISTFSTWIWDTAVRLGYDLPVWASTAISGLIELWNRLPLEIRELWTDWYAWINGFLGAVYAWCMDRYDTTVTVASTAYSWVTNAGAVLWQWRVAVYDVIDQIVADPVTWVVNILGSTWTWLTWFVSDPEGAILQIFVPYLDWLMWFAQDCLQYWYNLWSWHADTLSAFLANPLGWIYDRVEDELIGRW